VDPTAGLDVSDMGEASCLRGIKPLFLGRPAHGLFITIYFIRYEEWNANDS